MSLSTEVSLFLSSASYAQTETELTPEQQSDAKAVFDAFYAETLDGNLTHQDLTKIQKVIALKGGMTKPGVLAGIGQFLKMASKCEKRIAIEWDPSKAQYALADLIQTPEIQKSEALGRAFAGAFYCSVTGKAPGTASSAEPEVNGEEPPPPPPEE